MNFDEISFLLETFANKQTSELIDFLQQASPEERHRIAQQNFKLSNKLLSSILESSISETCQMIGFTMEVLFFNDLYDVSQQLQNNRDHWLAQLDLLRQIHIFKSNSNFDLMTFLKDATTIELKANEPFLKYGEPVHGVFILKEQASVYVDDQEEPIVTRNGIFGEEACATDILYATATVVPLKDCQALFINRERFVTHTRRIPGLQANVYSMIVNRAQRDRTLARDERNYAEWQRKLTQEILDHIGQGSFSINSAGEIQNYSKVAEEYLGHKDLAGWPFADIAFQQNKQALREYYRALSMIFGSNQMDPEIILSLLPTETTINRKIFNLFYFFAKDPEGYVKSVFVRMEDITLVRELEAKGAQEKSVLNKMHQNLGGFLTMIDNIKNSLELVNRFAEEWSNKPTLEQEIVNDLLRVLHGSKGLSGQFELLSLRDVIHELEDDLRAMGSHGLEEKQLASFDQHLMEFQREYDYAVSFKDNLGPKIIQLIEGVSFSQNEFQGLLASVKQSDWETVQHVIIQKTLIPAETIIDNWERDIQRLARSLGKQIQLNLQIQENLQVPKVLAVTLNTELGHLYRNCVDHGIELSEERTAHHKPEIGTIHVKIHEENGILSLVIKDDGRGLNQNKIAEIAQKNPELDQHKVSRYIQSGKHWKILFLPGFSSASKVTSLSGRGVGLDAVKNAVERLGGSIVMASETNKGSVFMIKMPLSFV